MARKAHQVRDFNNMTGVVVGPAPGILQNAGGLFEGVVPNACQVTLKRGVHLYAA